MCYKLGISKHTRIHHSNTLKHSPDPLAANGGGGVLLREGEGKEGNRDKVEHYKYEIFILAHAAKEWTFKIMNSLDLMQHVYGAGHTCTSQ